MAVDLWSRAVPIRDEWLAHGLSTEPARRADIELSISRIYARINRAQPRFVWVDSPAQARSHIGNLPTHDDLYAWIMPKPPPGRPPFASDLLTALSRLRGALDASLSLPDPGPPAPKRKEREQWPPMPPVDGLRAGVPLREVLRRGIQEALFTSLAHGFYLPVRRALAGGKPLPTAWYGQQDAHWVGFYDLAHRLGLAHVGGADGAHFDDWTTLARGGGWWWPDEEVCVVVERPLAINTEPVPDAWHGELRLAGDRPIEYRDGWRPSLY
jgi:hypothetical protein